MGLGSSHLSLRYVLTVLVGAPSWSHRVALLVYSVAALNCLATTSDVTRVLNEVSLCVNFCLLSWFRSESGLIFLAKRWCCKILLRIWMPLLLTIFLKTLLFPQSRVLFSRFLLRRFSSNSQGEQLLKNPNIFLFSSFIYRKWPPWFKLAEKTKTQYFGLFFYYKAKMMNHKFAIDFSFVGTRNNI